MIRDRKTSRYDAIRRPRVVQIRAGILEEKGSSEHDGGLTIAELAEIHEFGASEAGIPERSFIRAWFDGAQTAIREIFLARFALAAAGRLTYEVAANQLALWCAAEMQRRIIAGIDPPLKQATIDRKGSSTPLIDHGVLKSAISAEASIA